MAVLARLRPIDPVQKRRVDVRVCSSDDERATGAAGFAWLPTLFEVSPLTLALFDGDFSSSVPLASARLALRLEHMEEDFPGIGSFDWSSAPVTLYKLRNGELHHRSTMRVSSFASEDLGLALGLDVDPEPLNADVLFNEYAGTTGTEGGADLAGTLKPWVFGRALNMEPVSIDDIDYIYQVSGYGPVQSINGVFENGASFGASVGDFADYDALFAADIQEGQWGTCHAEGLFRLGAPPAGVITCDVDGDNTSGFLRRTGAILREIARRLDVDDFVDTESLSALDAAVPYDVNIVITQQTTLLDLARDMVSHCNAVATVDLRGNLIAPRVAFGKCALTLDAQGQQMPAVLGMARQNTEPPFKRIQMAANRSYRVHSPDEIAYFSDIIPKGLYDADRVNREGHLVSSEDGSEWLYTNPVPTSGNEPPTWPTQSNGFWENSRPPTLIPFASIVDDGTKPADNATRNVSRGPYVETDTYSPGDIVSFNGTSRIRIGTMETTGIDPTDENFWDILSDRGEPGPAGADGLPGADGTPGTDGIDGQSGTSVAELNIYRRATASPSKPSGGSFDFGTTTLIPPSGWHVGIPSGVAPVYVARGVASTNQPGASDTPDWGDPALAFSDGQAVDAIFRRFSSQPSTPAASSGVPSGWFSAISNVPPGSSPIWTSFGKRAAPTANWIWETPVQIEGIDGAVGADGIDGANAIGFLPSIFPARAGGQFRGTVTLDQNGSGPNVGEILVSGGTLVGPDGSNRSIPLTTIVTPYGEGEAGVFFLMYSLESASSRVPSISSDMSTGPIFPVRPKAGGGWEAFNNGGHAQDITLVSTDIFFAAVEAEATNSGLTGLYLYVSGATGLDGVPGSDGAPGAAGEDGAQGAPGSDGADGTDGSDGADSFVVTPSVPALAVAANSSGVVVAGLPFTISMTAKLGGVDVTGSTTFSNPVMSGATVEKSAANGYRITAIAASNASFTFTATRPGYSQTVTIPLTRLNQGSAAQRVEDTTIVNTSSSTYVQVSDTLTLNVPSGDQAILSYSEVYEIAGTPSSGSQGRKRLRFMYRNVTDNGAWTQLGAELVGTFAIANYNVFPTEPEFVSGNVGSARSVTNSAGATKVFEFRIDMRREGVSLSAVANPFGVEVSS